MVVCKCRKATRLYCFVHKIPVCGECICFQEHQICVVKKYSDWVIDGEYDWPVKCSICDKAIEDGNDGTTRLGCLHLMHTKCLISHIKSYPSQTAPAGYVCPVCSTPLWPPVSIKDTGSRLHGQLKDAIIQSGFEKNVFGNHQINMYQIDSHAPPAFASDPLVSVSHVENGEHMEPNSFNANKSSGSTSASFGKDEKYAGDIYATSVNLEPEIVEIDGPSSLGTQEHSFINNLSPVGPGATTRKIINHADRPTSDTLYYADDEDVNHKKYSRRGPFHHKFFRMLLPFWSSALPTLPVTAPPRKDNVRDGPDGRTRNLRSSRMDPRKILLALAIMACMATMGILYYRLVLNLGDTYEEENQ